MKKTKNIIQESAKICPAFSKNDVAIVFAANDYFAPYMSVMIESIIEHQNSNRNYDIIILHRDIKQETQDLIRGMVCSLSNFEIRFLNVSSFIDEDKFFIGGKDDFTVDTYLRLLIPYVLSDEYKKVLYLDGDMVARTDVSVLYDEDITDYFLASTRDTFGLSVYLQMSSRKKYRDNVLKLTNPLDYFCAGVLLLNLKMFRDNYTMDELLDFAASRKWRQHDQDVLNVICNGGKAKILDESWQVLRPYKTELLPQNIFESYKKAYLSPKIIHYGGIKKPWKEKTELNFEAFWDYALKTPFSRLIVLRAVSNSLSNASKDAFNQEMENRFLTGRVGTKSFIRCIKAYLKSKWHNFGF